MHRICFVLCYLGPLPRYVPAFLASCAHNRDVDFLIASDQPAPDGLAPNVRWLPTTLDNLQRRFSDTVGFEVALTSGYKLCDFKPVIGHAFSGELAGYDFWGITDPDLVWGHIRSFATDERLVEHDVLSFRGRGYVSGPATLFRNDERLRTLYAQAPGYKAVFRDPKTRAFTEVCGRWKQTPTVASLVEAGQIVSFTDVVREADGLRWLDVDEIIEWGGRGSSFHLGWREGHLYDEKTGREVLMYHLVSSKKNPLFFVPAVDELPEQFSITERGLMAPEGASWIEHIQYEGQRVVHWLPRKARMLRSRLRATLVRRATGNSQKR